MEQRMRKIVGRALIEIFERGGIHYISVRNVDKLPNSSPLTNILTWSLVVNTSFITPIATFDKEHVDRIYKKSVLKWYWNNSQPRKDDRDLTALHGLDVTKIRALHFYTTRTVSIEGIKWEKQEKTPKERQLSKSQNSVTWQDCIFSWTSQAERQRIRRTHFIRTINEESEGVTPD